VSSFFESIRAPIRFAPALEAAYQADLAQEKARAFFWTSVLCSFLYLCFGVLDMYVLTSNVEGAWAVRAIVVLFSALATASSRLSREAFLRNYSLLVCLLYLWWGMGIETIILLAAPSDLGFSTYYAGLILVSMALYTWTYLHPLHAALTGLALVLSYVALALGSQHMGKGGDWIVLVQNCFFLISANVVGAFSLYMRERFSRQAFLLKNALAHDLKLEEEAKRQSEHLSEHDPLTGLPNRVRFLRKLDTLLSVRSDAATVAVLFIDLDNFKPVNDQHGHAAGDHVLRVTAERVRGTIRSSDLAARLGGDEFVVALPLAQQQGTGIVERVSNALRATIAEPILFNGEVLRVSASIGAAASPVDGQTAEALLHAADQHMYQHKRHGKSLMAA
jgi:diguanylate cyclase (GGDEF)-like protein